MNKLLNKVAIVTGAGTGMGKAIAQAYAREGADVAIVYSSSRAGAEDTLKLVEAEGRKGIIIQCELADADQINNVVKTTYDTFGHIDIVVNNAAARDAMPIWDYTLDIWRHCYAVNLRSMFVMAKAVVPIMKAQKSGYIINVGSIQGVRPSLTPRLAYGSTKSGIEAFTRLLAEEVGEYGIYVNCLIPGTINTKIGGLSTAITDDVVKARSANIALRRRGEPVDIVGPAIFLACEDCSYVDGTYLIVDGGYLNGD